MVVSVRQDPNGGVIIESSDQWNPDGKRYHISMGEAEYMYERLKIILKK